MVDIPNVDEVVNGLYISGARAAYQGRLLRKAGISRVLKLYFDAPYWPFEMRVFDNPIEDGLPVPRANLVSGMAFIHQGRAANERVLVACRAGISRSSTFVLAHLIESGYDLPDAWQLLKRQHPPSWPALALWRSLLEHYELPYTMDDVSDWLR